MDIQKHGWLVFLGLAVLAIAAGVVGEVFKVAWVAVWLAPILMVLCFASISTLYHRPDATAGTRAGKVASYAKVTAFALVLYAFISIEVVSDAPVALRLMGWSVTMSGYAASRFLEISGLAIGATGVWLNASQRRREAAAAVLANAAGGPASPRPPAAPTP